MEQRGEGHLLRLRCGEGVDVDALSPQNEWGEDLFGLRDVSCEIVAVSPFLSDSETFYIDSFWTADEEGAWDGRRLVKVKDCLTFTTADLGNDGVTELIVRI